MKTPAEEAISLIVRAINAWLRATGHAERIAAHDIVVTRRDVVDADGRTAGVWFLAFQEVTERRSKPS